MKNYLLTLLQQCSEEQFGQDAVEYAIVSGAVTLTYDLETDLRTIMGQPGKPETGQYDAICEAYQRVCRDLEQQTAEVMQPLIEEILRPVSLARQIP